MNKERSQQAISILDQYKDGLKNKGEQPPIVGYSIDPVSQEHIGYYISMEKNSNEVAKLESLGFKVIYPAELTEDAISQMTVADKFTYELKMKRALVVDKQEPKHSLEFAEMISNHYLSADPLQQLWGIDEKRNTISRNIGLGHHPEGTAESLQRILNDVGVSSTLEGENLTKSITISSEVPYHTVDPSIYAQMHNDVRHSIGSTFDRLKKSTSPTQENYQERE